MMVSLTMTLFILCYVVSGFSWRAGYHLFGWSFFAPLLVAFASIAWRSFDMEPILLFVSAKIGQSQALSSLWGAVVGVFSFWLYVAGTQSGYLTE